MLSVTAPIRNIRFRNIWCGFQINAINADAARYCRTPLFKENDYPEGVGEISDITFEGFTCKPMPRYSAEGKMEMPRVALRLEANMDNFNVCDFEYISGGENIPALVAKNLVNNSFTADGKSFELYKKEEVLTLADFKNLSVNKIR